MIDEKIKGAWTLLNAPTASDDPMIAAAFVIASAYVEAEARARLLEHRLECSHYLRDNTCAIGLGACIIEVEAELSK